MEYYFADGSDKRGPFTLEELRHQPINRDTLVWFTGQPNWKPASEIPELASLLDMPPLSVPPPLTRHVSQENKFITQVPPKTWLLESILVTLFCCLPFGIVGIINASRVESKFYSGDFQGAQQASGEAGKWTKIGFWIGIAGIVLYIIFLLIFGFSSFAFLDDARSV